jgi:molybdenum cofactor cytidylyltransferase
VNICVLVLAAGRATRFGADKRLAVLPGGIRVIDTVLQEIKQSGLPFLVCLGADDAALAGELQQRDIAVHRCARATEGMGGTLAEGISQIAAYDGVLVSLSDMPWIKATTYAAVAAGLSAGEICVPRYELRSGHPVGFPARYFPELAALGGDSGARSLLEKYAISVHEVPVDDPAIHRDIDLPADLQRSGLG